MRFISCILFLLPLLSLCAQDLSGHWEGFISQDGKTDTFLYQVDLQPGSKGYPGTSFSQTKDGSASATFQLTAYLDGRQLILQELGQLEPPKPKWCLKYANLTLEQFPFHDRLSGPWKADGCKPGQMFLDGFDKLIADDSLRPEMIDPLAVEEYFALGYVPEPANGPGRSPNPTAIMGFILKWTSEQAGPDNPTLSLMTTGAAPPTGWNGNTIPSSSCWPSRS